ncbi:YafY family protein [Clostridium sp.]|uniref:helix-turn-helix transcriptional regulator n=1 Tax=Clostridium sp. TaxID=1506 RepID=UPI0025BF98CA|nr:HTH domain-containing protein [Clostridium sp.]MCI9069076.1 HTH domain-containing protein [Clostridium sp.]
MRLLEIVFYLLRTSSKVTINELSRIYNVSTRTIKRDLDKLSVLGIPIMIHRGKNGGVQLDESYLIRRQLLTDSDYEELILALYIGENISNNIDRAFLIDKFKMLGNKKAFEVFSKLKDRFIIDLYEEKFDVKSKVCREIDKALESKSFLEIETKDEKSSVIPISYVLRKEGLCLYYYNKIYKIILIKEITNAKFLNKIYNKKLISYTKNKNNLQVL